MAIVSISLPESILKEIDALKKMGYAGRSEVIRTAVRSLIAETRESENLKGKIDGVILVVHDDIHTEEVSTIRHRHERIIKTHIHNQLENSKCLELFVVSGDSRDILSLEDALKTNKKIGFVKLIMA